MKFYTLLTAVLLAFAMAGCEKEEDLSPKDKDSPTGVQQQITEDLAEQENISGFVEAFKALELNREDIEEGITIFAPTDAALEVANANNGRLASSTADTPELSQEMLKDHIVKGVIEATSLQDGDTLITLNGKQLVITVDGDAVRVNGVLLSEKNVATNAKYVVHTVEEILSNTTPQDSSGSKDATGTIEITVWNGARWSPENPKGEIEAGATVSLYKSREDYAQENAAAYTMQTGAEGKAIFTAIDTAKTYYIVAEKNDMSNLFYVTQRVDGGLVGMVPDGIFQSQAEIDAHAEQPDAKPGNFRWKDVNGDDLINEMDYTPAPYRTAKSAYSQTVQIDITIGFDNNYTMGYIKSEEVALQKLRSSYERLDAWQKDFVIIDGTLSDDANCGNSTNLCAIDNFQFTPTHNIIYRLWNEGYGIIGQLNHLLRDVPGLAFTGKDAVIAQAKGLRAYVYLQLLTYFGEIPIQTDLKLDLEVEQATDQEVYDLIVTDLEAAANGLPASWPSDKSYQISQYAVWSLLAKAKLWNEEYDAVAELTERVLANGGYQLMANKTMAFEDVDNAEIIWDFSFGITSNDLHYFYNVFFYGRSFCPAMRLAEVYLMHAEAKFELDGINEDGINSLNKLRTRMGMSTVDGTYNVEELKEALRATWKEAMPREGNRFANLIRWEKASEVLGPLGFQPHHALLPIPQSFIDQYPNINQNLGY